MLFNYQEKYNSCTPIVIHIQLHKTFSTNLCVFKKEPALNIKIKVIHNVIMQFSGFFVLFLCLCEYFFLVIFSSQVLLFK